MWLLLMTYWSFLTTGFLRRSLVPSPGAESAVESRERAVLSVLVVLAASPNEVRSMSLSW